MMYTPINKKQAVLATLLFFVVACNPQLNEEEIVLKARQFYFQSPQNPLQEQMETFERFNYRMPRNMGEVEKMIKRIAKDNGFSDWNAFPTYPPNQRLKRWRQLLHSSKYYFISFPDSCFFYSPRWKIGCAVYESHCSLINTDARDYRIRPIAFLNRQGLNILDWEKEEQFYTQLQQLESEYTYTYKLNRDYKHVREELLLNNPDFLLGSPIYLNTQYRRILVCVPNSTPSFYCSPIVSDSLWVEHIITGLRIEKPKHEPEYVCRDFIERVDQLAQTYMSMIPDCIRVLIPIPFIF